MKGTVFFCVPQCFYVVYKNTLWSVISTKVVHASDLSSPTSGGGDDCMWGEGSENILWQNQTTSKAPVTFTKP